MSTKDAFLILKEILRLHVFYTLHLRFLLSIQGPVLFQLSGWVLLLPTSELPSIGYWCAWRSHKLLCSQLKHSSSSPTYCQAKTVHSPESSVFSDLFAPWAHVTGNVLAATIGASWRRLIHGLTALLSASHFMSFVRYQRYQAEGSFRVSGTRVTWVDISNALGLQWWEFHARLQYVEPTPEAAGGWLTWGCPYALQVNTLILVFMVTEVIPGPVYTIITNWTLTLQLFSVMAEINIWTESKVIVGELHLYMNISLIKIKC